MKSDELLAHYSQRLKTVEINSSFYTQPKAEIVKRWSEKTSEAFRFAFKAPQLITHNLKLGKGSSEAAHRFSETIDLLGPRRGPVLFQLPPYLKQDLHLLGGFMSETADIIGRVFEFRHASWLRESTFRLLEENGAAFCIAETEDLEPVFRVTGGMGYFRLRKDSYDARTVGQWARKIRETTKGLQESYVYMRHDETGKNAVLAERLSERLETA